MLRIFDSKKNHRTEIFFGRSYSSTSYGSIEVIGEGDTAKITLTDTHHRCKQVKLQVFELDTLKKMPIYLDSLQQPGKPGIEVLVNTWVTRQYKNTIIKYANQDQLAFIFSSDSDIDNDFNKLFAEDFANVNYFNEIKFCFFIHYQLGLTIDKLRAIPGINNRIELLMNNQYDLAKLIKLGLTLEEIGAMEDNRIQQLLKNTYQVSTLCKNSLMLKQLIAINDNHLLLLLDNMYGLTRLLKHGITIEQMGAIDIQLLKKLLDSQDIAEILTFITIQQILGIDHTPPALSTIKKINKNENYLFNTSGSASFDNVSYQYTDDTVKVQHADEKTKTKTNFGITFGTLPNNLVEEYQNRIKEMIPEILIHDWYIIHKKIKDNIANTEIYSPSLKCIINEISDLQFPNNLLKTDLYVLLRAPYYQEKQFELFLNKNGYSITEIKALPGMSQKKIILLCQHRETMAEIMALGVKMDDFAKIDEIRLDYIISHFYQAKKSLKFIDVFELLGISKYSHLPSPKFFKPDIDNKFVTEQLDNTNEPSINCCII